MVPPLLGWRHEAVLDARTYRSRRVGAGRPTWAYFSLIRRRWVFTVARFSPSPRATLGSTSLPET
jgi:hypothetical protein